MSTVAIALTCSLSNAQVPREREWLSVLHLTPLRASRSLAMRYLAHRFGLDMAHVTVLFTPPAVPKVWTGPKQSQALLVVP